MRGPKPTSSPNETGALAAAYQPVVGGYLLGCSIYYAVIAASHLWIETGWRRVAMTGLAGATSLGCWWLRRRMRRRTPTMAALEVGALVANGLMFANVALYFSIHFEPQKLVYFVLMALVFATASPTRRVMLPSVAVALLTLPPMASWAGRELVEIYFYVGVAGAFAAIGMAQLMRGALLREVRARLTAEASTASLEEERRRIAELQAETHDLAVQAQAASRAKSEFLSTISHELRTPLNAILGMSHALAPTLGDETQRGRLSAIESEGRNLQKLINDLIDISNLEASRLDLHPEPFDLGRLADDLADLYGPVAADNGLDLEVALEPEARGWRLGDDVRLRQVLGNLISNAIKFTATGAVAVAGRCDGDTLTFSVADTGQGIAPSQMETLFDRFVQADGSATRRFGGAGLGLAICKELVDLMGGQISVVSELGHGACFTFDVAMPAADAPAASERPAPPPTARTEPLSVLVVDDNHINRLVLQTLLSQWGVASSSVENGREAVEAWSAGAWDAILMDVHMPEMDGVSAAREIRAREAASGRARTPIIAVTASFLAEETSAYMAAGMDGCVPKPIELAQLGAMLGDVLGGLAGARDAA